MSNTDFHRFNKLFFITRSQQTLTNLSFRPLNVVNPLTSVATEIFSTVVTDEELAEAVEDEYGAKYSRDGKRLLKMRFCNLKDYCIKPGTKVICDKAFFYYWSLQSINIPNSVTNIGELAFACCESLQNINIPDLMTTISDGAFYSCPSLQSINIPHSVTSIGKSAFYECESLQSINIPRSVTRIGDSAFSCCNLQIDNDSASFLSDGHCLIDLSSNRLLCCYNNDFKSYSIPDYVTAIGDMAFDGCKMLESINIPDKVTSIGFAAFYRCLSLRTVKIPHSVKIIEDEAFSFCTSLQSIYIPRNTKPKFMKLLPNQKDKLIELD